MKQWYLWWITRYGGGQWFGPQYLSDSEAFHVQFDIEFHNSDARAYRLLWDGSQWNYDTRLLVA